MNRTSRLERLLNILEQVKQLGIEYDAILGINANHSELSRDLNDGLNDDGFPIDVRHAYSQVLSLDPPRSIEEVREYPRTMQPEALWWYTEKPHRTAFFFQEEWRWPRQYALEILDNHPEAKSSEDVKVLMTQLIDKTLEANRCIECNGPLGTGFAITQDQFHDSIADKGVRFTCERCLESLPDKEDEHRLMRFVRVFTVHSGKGRRAGS